MEGYTAIPGYEGLYEINKEGTIISVKRNKELSKAIINSGYETVDLFKDGNRKKCLVHRLVMLTFEGESELHVNHIDGIRTNNVFSNLEYCTRSENMLHSFHVLGTGVIPNNGFGKDNKQSKKVLQSDLEGNEIKEWDSIADIVRALGLSQGNISGVCKGTRRQTGGFIFKFI